MTEDKETQKILENIIEDEMRGCVLCNSHVDLVYCELESPINGSSHSLLCFSCRQEYLFNDEGFIDDDKLAECFNQAWEDEDDEDWEDEDY